MIITFVLAAGAAVAVAGPAADPTPQKAAREQRHVSAASSQARDRVPHPRRRTASSASATAGLGRVEPRVINAGAVFTFAEGAVYQVYTAPERVTDIVLEPGEGLTAVASGDTARWVIGDTASGAGPARRAHILVKPFSSGLSTNLVITTDRRTYHLSVASRAGGAMSSVSWTYPADALIALKRAADEAAAPVAAGLAIDLMHFEYAISGDRPDWRPVRAFDDGRQTFIEFPAAIEVGEAPPLFLVDGKGAAQLVNYRLRGRFYVVDRLFDAAELRLGSKRQQVVRITRTTAKEVGAARRRRGR